MTPSTKSCCLYVRVSKSDGTMTVANQEPELRQMAKARGFEILQVYADHESAYRRRPGFEKMMEDARRGKTGCSLMVWSLDRLGRGFSCFDAWRSLAAYGVTVVSAREPWSEVEGPQRDLLAAIMSWVSGFERSRLVERTRAGMERARREGKRIGRRPARVDLEKALQLRAEGLGLRSAAKKLGVGASTLGRILKAADALGRTRDGLDQEQHEHRPDDDDPTPDALVLPSCGCADGGHLREPLLSPANAVAA